MANNPRLAKALQLLEMGYPTIPVRAGEKKPFIRGWNKVYPDADKLTKWWRQFPDAVPGLLMGRGIGCIDVDVKGDADGRTSLNALGYESGQTMLPCDITPSGGMHLFCKVDNSQRSMTRHDEGLELKANNTFVVVYDNWEVPLVAKDELPEMPACIKVLWGVPLPYKPVVFQKSLSAEELVEVRLQDIVAELDSKEAWQGVLPKVVFNGEGKNLGGSSECPFPEYHKHGDKKKSFSIYPDLTGNLRFKCHKEECIGYHHRGGTVGDLRLLIWRYKMNDPARKRIFLEAERLVINSEKYFTKNEKRLMLIIIKIARDRPWVKPGADKTPLMLSGDIAVSQSLQAYMGGIGKLLPDGRISDARGFQRALAGLERKGAVVKRGKGSIRIEERRITRICISPVLNHLSENTTD